MLIIYYEYIQKENLGTASEVESYCRLEGLNYLYLKLSCIKGRCSAKKVNRKANGKANARAAANKEMKQNNCGNSNDSNKKKMKTNVMTSY